MISLFLAPVYTSVFCNDCWLECRNSLTQFIQNKPVFYYDRWGGVVSTAWVDGRNLESSVALYIDFHSLGLPSIYTSPPWSRHSGSQVLIGAPPPTGIRFLFVLITETLLISRVFWSLIQCCFVFSFVLWVNNCLLFDGTLLQGEILKGELVNNLPSLHKGVP